MDTPKRIKTISSPYVNSPPPVGSPAALGGNRYNITGSGGHWSSGWPPEALSSPVSSCSSPEAMHLTKARPLIGTPTTNTPGGQGGNNGWNQHQNPLSSEGSGSAEKSENKRGRPRSELLTSLMVEGSISPSAIKCRYCNRVFPREKSLQAHLRTHTGERPYQCDYPGCSRAFTQSGQLKTHQRLHTGERPFICSAANCMMRFTHANRHCPDHPYDTLKRCDDFVIQAIPEQNSEVLRWLEKYRSEREDRTPTRKTPKRPNQSSQNENENRSEPSRRHNNENYAENGSAFQSPLTPRSPFKSRKGLMCELDMNAGMGLSASPITAKTKPNLPKMIQWQEPTSQEEDDSGDESNCEIPARSTFNPKKKWLRDAWQEDLAKPLEPNIISPQVLSSTTSTAALKQQLMSSPDNSSPKHQVITIDPNLMRPTVLMVASKDRARPLDEQPTIHTTKKVPGTRPEETNRKLQGALALMQLATEETQAFIGQYGSDMLASTSSEIVQTHDLSSTIMTPSSSNSPAGSSCINPSETTPITPLHIPLISTLCNDIDYSIPFTLAAENYANGNNAQ
ncbi:Krueppel homolog 1-like [Uranotaenia lowii]|uniref:Krueppel homolog 1-like n=1 Tax=Uranotaenia lowii TaxID=190385 RepID=UPI002479F9BE|nr:Krueppel homolog 1-like [Uranotaenia lowii]